MVLIINDFCSLPVDLQPVLHLGLPLLFLCEVSLSLSQLMCLLIQLMVLIDGCSVDASDGPGWPSGSILPDLFLY